MLIGIDIDEVLVHFFKSYLELFNKRFGENVSVERLYHFHIWEETNVSKEDSLKLSEEFYNSALFHKMDLVEYAVETLEILFKNHKIFFITSRPLDLKEKTHFFLEKLFPNEKINLHFSSGIWSEDLETKGEICKKIGIDYMVEDNVLFSNECSKNGIKTFLLNKPWNQNEKIEKNVIRINNWKEILKEIGIN